MDLGKLVSTLLLGALAIGGCEGSSGSSGRCNEGREWSEEEKSCVEYSDASQPGDAFVARDYSTGPEDLVVPDVSGGIEDVVEPYTPPANCVICDEFSDPKYTETSWEILQLGSDSKYDISDGVLTLQDYMFHSPNRFDFNSHFEFEIRYKLPTPDAMLSIMLDPTEGGNTVITVNKMGNGKIKAFVGPTYEAESDQISIDQWQTFRMVSDEEGLGVYSNGTSLFQINRIPKPSLGQLRVAFAAPSDPVKIDYIRVTK
jgi:hypothetical protein